MSHRPFILTYVCPRASTYRTHPPPLQELTALWLIKIQAPVMDVFLSRTRRQALQDLDLCNLSMCRCGYRRTMCVSAQEQPQCCSTLVFEAGSLRSLEFVKDARFCWFIRSRNPFVSSFLKCWVPSQRNHTWLFTWVLGILGLSLPGLTLYWQAIPLV